MVAIQLLFGGFHARSKWGERLAGDVKAKRVLVDDDGNKEYRLDVKLLDRDLQPTVSGACYERVEEGDRIPVLLSRRGMDSWQVGVKPSVNLAVVFGGFGIAVAGLIAFVAVLRASRRWHGGRLLDETE